MEEDATAHVSVVAAASGVVLVASLALLIYRFSNHGDTVSEVAPSRSAPAQSTNGGVEDVKSAAAQVLVLYGTQTGTAERFAKKIGAEVSSRFSEQAHVHLADIEDFDFKAETPKADVLILLFATYGDGEPTDTAVDFVEWLQAEEEADHEPFLGKHFSVFGLGNRQYEHFNATGKQLDKSLGRLGGERLAPIGLGDDDECIEEDLEKWSTALWTALGAQLGGGGGGAAAREMGPLSYEAEVVEEGVEAGSMDAHASGKGISRGRVLEVRELHRPSSGRSCVHVEVELSSAAQSYIAGDHVGVHPENPPEAVALAALLLGVPLDAMVRLALPKGELGELLPPPPPTPAHLRTLLTHHADLLGAPSRAALAALATTAADPKEASRLSAMAKPEGKADYAAYVTTAQRSLLDVMQAFPSARPGLGVFFGSISPRLQPRYYSISSAPTATAPKPTLSITAAVVDEVTPGGRHHKGVASNWLAGLSMGGSLPLHLRTSTFKLPRKPSTPIVMVGPGTGLAPFRGFLQARTAQAATGVTLGPAILFFGCRDRHKDYIYEEELQSFVANGALSELHTAFSRQDPQRKDYVQHHLRARAASVWPLLREDAGGVLYVCGDAKHMARDVHAAMTEVVQEVEGCEKEAATAAVQRLSDTNRYHRDVW